MLGLGNTLSKTSNSVTPGAGGSPPPVGFDKTWTFSSTTEGWVVYGQGTIAQAAAYTPLSDDQRTGVLVIRSTGTSFSPTIAFDFSTLPDYDNTQPLYYLITFSAASTSNFTGIRKVVYGAGGDESTHIAGTQDIWDTVSGTLVNSGSDDEIVIHTLPSSGVTATHTMHIDSIRFSHTNFLP